jgi:hypothetical protein
MSLRTCVAIACNFSIELLLLFLIEGLEYKCRNLGAGTLRQTKVLQSY